MKKVKRPYTKANSLCFGSNKNRVKKLYIKDSRLYLGEGIKGGAFGAIAASLVPSLTGWIAKLFDGNKRIKRRGRYKYSRRRNNIVMVKRQTPKRIELSKRVGFLCKI